VTNQKNPKPSNLYAPQNTLLVSTRVKVLLTFLVGLVLSILTVFVVQQQYLELLTQRVESMATLLDPARVQSLKTNDENSAENERYIKRQLQEARGANADARFLYLLAITNTNDVYFLADSEPAGTERYSARGQRFVDASEELKAAFFSNKTHMESSVRDKSGSWRSTLSPVYDHTGQLTAMLGMDIPVSTYNTIMGLAAAVPLVGAALVSVVFLMTDAIRQRRQENLRMRSELVSIASHELRTPLTGIRWGEESLLNTKLVTSSREILRTMYDSTIRLQESIEDILQLANWQAGRKQELVRTTVDIGQLLDGIFATQKLSAAQKNIKLEYAPNWPEKLLIDCDAQRMKRVFNNLVSNAVKYSNPSTSIVVTYQKVDGNHVISITDHGIGIPKSEQSKVFAGFYRASNAISHESSGTGMGLYMSRSAVEQHDGKLWLASEEGKGTTVYIQLP